MSTYVPAELIATKTLGNGSANIATFQKQNTAGPNTFDEHRTLLLASNVGAQRTLTVQMGSSAASDGTQVLVSNDAITALKPKLYNWAVKVPNNSYFSAYTNGTAITGGSWGYTVT